MGKENWKGRVPRFAGCRRAAFVIVTAAALAACTSNEGINAPPKRLTPEFVVGAAAAALQADGRFAFDDAVVRPSGQLSEVDARAIASQYVQAMAPTLLGFWSKYHGARVLAGELRPCDRALYAASAYVSLTGDAAEITRRTWGPHWVVPMCGRVGQVQVVVAFSSLAIELVGDSRGTPTPWERANVSSVGVPLSAASWMYNPEQATAKVFEETGRRVRSVPALMMGPRPESPVLVRWRVDLEGPVTVEGRESSAVRERSTLYVGFADQFDASGVLDKTTEASELTTSWTDPFSNAQVSAVLSPLAPRAMEVVRKVAP